MDSGAQRRRVDPLERIWHGRAVVLVIASAVFVSMVASAAGGTPSELPGIALGSPALLHLERALLVGAAIAGSSIFLTRGWAGYFPSKLSTAGAEYAALTTAENAGELAAALAEVKIEHLAMAESFNHDINRVRQGLRVLGEEIGPDSGIDDIVGDHGSG